MNKKPYSLDVRIPLAGEVARFLTYNAKSFRGCYIKGVGLYRFKVDTKDRTFLNDLISALEGGSQKKPKPKNVARKEKL